VLKIINILLNIPQKIEYPSDEPAILCVLTSFSLCDIHHDVRGIFANYLLSRYFIDQLVWFFGILFGFFK